MNLAALQSLPLISVAAGQVVFELSTLKEIDSVEWLPLFDDNLPGGDEEDRKSVV